MRRLGAERRSVAVDHTFEFSPKRVGAVREQRRRRQLHAGQIELQGAARAETVG